MLIHWSIILSYASLCSEEFFHFEVIVHIVSFYALVASIGFALVLRSYTSWCRTLSATYLTKKSLPVFDKRLSVGGLTLSIWIVGIILATTAFWYGPEAEYWSSRTDALDWADAKVRLVVTSIIGHHVDMVLGLLLIPVSRNSILGRAFQLHQGTLLYAHKLLAYTFLVAAAAHGAAYYVSSIHLYYVWI